jgi:hypothetical protein
MTSPKAVAARRDVIVDTILRWCLKDLPSAAKGPSRA